MQLYDEFFYDSSLTNCVNKINNYRLELVDIIVIITAVKVYIPDCRVLLITLPVV